MKTVWGSMKSFGSKTIILANEPLVNILAKRDGYVIYSVIERMNEVVCAVHTRNTTCNFIMFNAGYSIYFLTKEGQYDLSTVY